jgi:hypothetical protein
MKLECETVKKFLPFVIILFVAFALWWCPSFLGHGYIYVGDTPFPLTESVALRELQSRLYLWNNGELGYVNFYLGDMPYYLFIFVLSELDLPLYVINRLVFILPSIISGLFTYYLTSTFIEGKHSRAICTICSLFAIVTPAQVFQNPIIDFSFAGFPLVLGLFIRGLKEEGRKYFYAILISFASVLVMMTPFAAVLTLGVVTLYLLMHILLTKKFSYADLKFVLLATILTVLVNFYVVYPFLNLYTHSNILATVYSNPNQLGGIGIVKTYADASGLLYVSRLILRPNIQPVFSYYDTSITLVFSFMVPIFAYLSLFQKKSHILIIATIAILLTIFSTGLHYPVFSTVYMWLWDRIPLFQVLNTPSYYQYTLSFLYALLIGLTAQMLITWHVSDLKKRLKVLPNKINNLIYNVSKPCVILGLALIIILANGSMALNLMDNPRYTINQGRALPPIQIPTSYYLLQDYLQNSNSSNFRILVLPFQDYVVYNWYSEAENSMLLAAGVLPGFSPSSIIGVNPQMNPAVTALMGNLTNREIQIAVGLMQLLNIEYVLVSKDLIYNNWANNNPEYPSNYSFYLALFDNAYNIFEPVMDTPEFTLYKLRDAYLTQVFFTDSLYPITPNSWEDIAVFDGETSYIAVEPSNSLSLSNSGSIFAWILSEEANPSGQSAVNPTIICFGPNKAFRLYIDGASQHLCIAWFDGKEIDSNFTVQTGVWYLVGFTVSGSTETIYVDGSPVLSESYLDAVPTDGLPLFIGHDGTTSFFDGYISNVQIYQTALSDGQIASLFKEGTNGPPVDGSLAGWWPLNDSQSQALDLSSNNNTGTIIGNVSWTKILTGVNFGEISHVAFSTLNPTEYTINMDVTSPSYLVLNEQFDSNWVAYVNGELISNHSSFNNYANAWFINETGQLTINLSYLPQSTVMPAYLVSALTMSVLVLYVIWALIKPKFFLTKRIKMTNTQN